ncbi:Glycogen synthase [Chlamydiales bacterium STE3]|nr:Glycogen synthase [Chlamydiales bacterium STE3]
MELQPMHLIHIASELAPVAKVGGLADVLLGLNRELSRKKHDVDIIIPKYDCMDSDEIRDLSIYKQNVLSFYDNDWHSNTVWLGWVENLKVYFIEPHHPRYFFERGCYYGCEDDIERYLYFSRAVLDFLDQSNIHPDILHLHDWQTAIISVLYKDLFKDKNGYPTKTVFTIHNLEYQGKCASHDLNRIGLKGDSYLNPEKMQDPYQPDILNLLKGGIVYSDYITTVSKNYAWEVQTPEGGRGLDTTLREHSNKFSGILNGIDYSYWNPEVDRYLPTHYSSRETPLDKKDRNTIDKKAYIKKLLRERLTLAEAHRPIVGCITRLVPQKGIEMIKHTLLHIVEKGGQFVLLGSSPIASISSEFHQLKQQFTDHPHIHLILHHQEELAHMIFAGSDMLIVPSLFEPCGLTQLIAMKYGSVPIVRKTGGLADTVFDVDYSCHKFEETNGYTFDYPDAQGIDSALDRAIKCWTENPEKWRKLMINCMNIDFSWNKSSNAYLDIYKKVIEQ